MTDMHTRNETHLPHIPDNMNIVQFMLDFQHEIRPRVDDDIPLFVDSKTGRGPTMSQLRRCTYGLANVLASDYGIGENDTVMLLSPNHIDYATAVWSVQRLGGIVTCSNPQFTADELCHQLRVASVTFMIVHSTVLDLSSRAAHLCGLPSDRIVVLDNPSQVARKDTRSAAAIFTHKTVPDLITKGIKKARSFTERILRPGEGKTKVALLSWSSGTTGTPKAVAIPHYALIANVIQIALHHKVGKGCSVFKPGDTALGVLPFFHVAGFLITLHFVTFCSMSLVVPSKYDFLDMVDNLVRHRVSHVFLVPPQATTLSQYRDLQKHDLCFLKSLLIGAAPLSQRVQERLCAMLPKVKIGQVYGMTEMTTVVAMLPADQQHGTLGSSGRLLPGIEARVLRPDGTIATSGEPGELVLRGPANTLGYWKNASATNETFVDGWVHTGDQVVLTDDREVFVQDRLKEFLKVKGFQVAPAELEGTLLGHPDVLDCCVVGTPDDRRGEVPLAYVVLSPEARKRVEKESYVAHEIQESITQYVAQRKVRYKHLVGGVKFIEAIPRNGSGKALRRILRQQAREAYVLDLKSKL